MDLVTFAAVFGPVCGVIIFLHFFDVIKIPNWLMGILLVIALSSFYYQSHLEEQEKKAKQSTSATQPVEKAP